MHSYSAGFLPAPRTIGFFCYEVVLITVKLYCSRLLDSELYSVPRLKEAVIMWQGEDDEAEGEEEDDDGWMVPHGYLSEGEGCEDDEEVKPLFLSKYVLFLSCPFLPTSFFCLYSFQQIF